MTILILAGGFGTRLKKVVANVPKPMADICGKPFLTYQIDAIRRYYPQESIYLLTHYKSEIIQEYFQEDNKIRVIEEKDPLGTGGSILNAIKILNLNINETLLILNGDTFLEVDFYKIVNKSFYDVTLLASFQKDCSRYGSLIVSKNEIKEFKEKIIHTKNEYINAGCYFFKNLNFFSKIKNKRNSFSIENEFQEYLKNNKIGVCKYEGVFIDIGIPNDYEKMKKYMSAKHDKK